MAISNTSSKHPYLDGNFAPVYKEHSMEPCRLRGRIPDELVGGQYIHNGGNPFMYAGAQLARYHLFDGHGMLRAVYFNLQRNKSHEGRHVQPLYSNKYILTDVFLGEKKMRWLGAPILPSISTLLDPNASLLDVIKGVLSAMLLVLWSWLNPSLSSIRRISVANTSIIAHSGRALAMCESGPPMQIQLPELSTVGWCDLSRQQVQARSEVENNRGALANVFARSGLLGFFREWTTAHPHIDPVSGDMVMFHSSLIRPFVHYSVVAGADPSSRSSKANCILSSPVPGICSPKMMHDFGVSRQHSVIIDMPLSLDPFNIARGKPVINFNSKDKTRFGLIPRHHPEKIQWTSTEACCIFHTVNTWDDDDASRHSRQDQQCVNMLVCRMTGPSIIYATGNIRTPNISNRMKSAGKEECRLYYYQFSIGGIGGVAITQQWALTAIPFELPHVPGHLEMSATQFVYGCSALRGDYVQHLESAMKVSSLVKVNVRELIARGIKNPPSPVSGCVDERPIEDIIAAANANDNIQVFALPEGHYAQECSFVPRKGGGMSEDDGWIMTFVFDESQLGNDGSAPIDAKSELWIIDARNMKDVVARIELPGRVPYGFHGNWFDKEEIERQHHSV